MNNVVSPQQLLELNLPSRNLILTCHLSPGDILTLTAAIESLHHSYPGKYATDIRTSCNEIFLNNPWITSLKESAQGVKTLQMHYNSIDSCHQYNKQFITGYLEHLEQTLNHKIPLQVNRPVIYFSDSEKKNNVIDCKQYWIINAGIKNDYTCKQWPVEHYQKVVDDTCGLIQWVQIGENHQNHHKLSGVIDLIGKTSFRELMILALHSSGGLGPVTALMHLMAAVEKPYICINGGRETITWIQYQLQHTLHSIGLLDCCRTSGCWRSRTVAINDNQKSLNDNLCEYPILGGIEPSPKCMAMIHPKEVTNVLRRYVNPIYSSSV